MDRAFQHDALGNVHVRAIFDESRVERGEGIALDIQVTAQMLFNHGRATLDFSREIRDCDAIGQAAK